MSAFLVDDLTINKIVAAICNDRHMAMKFEAMGYMPNHLPQKLAEALFNMNCEAIRQRYGDDSDSRAIKYKPVLPPTNVPAYKHMSCLHYQCSEGTVPTTHLYVALEECIEYLAGEIISNLPEYQQTQWG